MAIDYRKILIAYINHVGQMEGVDMLGEDASENLSALDEEENIALAKARDATPPELGGRDRYRYYDTNGEPLK